MSALLTAPQMRQARRVTKYTGLTCFPYVPLGTDLELECWLEAEDGESRTYDHEGRDANATLFYAEIGGEDIAGILCKETISEIETAFLEQEFDSGDY